MEFSIRKLNPSDYKDVLVGWWKDWGWQAPAKDFLPDNGEGGLMVMVDDKPVCAGFIYISNSKVAWVEWIISDKKHKKKRKEAINLLLDKLIFTCKNLNMKYIFATNDNKNLINTFINKGFRKGSITTELIKKI
jgi:hypothetical protein